jgi:hypothetical protein
MYYNGCFFTKNPSQALWGKVKKEKVRSVAAALRVHCDHRRMNVSSLHHSSPPEPSHPNPLHPMCNSLIVNLNMTINGITKTKD